MATLQESFRIGKRRTRDVKEPHKAPYAPGPSELGPARARDEDVAILEASVAAAAAPERPLMWDVLQYDEKGRRDLTSAQRAVYAFVKVRAGRWGTRLLGRPLARAGPVHTTCGPIQANYEIPDGFERGHEYGAHSGTCYEERVISAYTFGQLPPRAGGRAAQMCSDCGREGHFSRHCPDVFEE